MHTITRSDLETNPSLYQQAKKILDAGGLVCFPSASGYKLAADLSSHEAINRMLQAKRRVKNAPALVFVPDEKWVKEVAASVNDAARALMRRYWPGPVTLLFEPNEAIDPKVRKPLTKAKGWIGVRLPDDEVPSNVVKAFGRPLLVSSANLATKHGASSVAQVRKNFGRTVDLLIDAGDLAEKAKSTLVDVSNGGASVVRAGAVNEKDILAAVG
ncbi:MAG: L-threonylcarbamoyladenylate synthase [Deltaproteobacteria bacterium]|nr:L-threonylcarbamoyladenylate synthase [Deltaproteobacteria bacterium]